MSNKINKRAAPIDRQGEAEEKGLIPAAKVK